MPFSVRLYRRFPFQCSFTYNAGPFIKLPLAYFCGFGSLITLLVLSSGPADAEWVSIGTDNQRGRTVYADPDTLRPKGDVVKMWSLNDYKTIQTGPSASYLSYKVQSEYDCAEERIRKRAATFFSGNMGRGDVVYVHSDEGKWQPVEPGSLGQSEWEVACDKE